MPQIPENAVEIGNVHVSVVLDERSTPYTTFEVEGLSYEQALGHLIAVQDRLRELVSYQWDESLFSMQLIEADCPHCGEHIDFTEEEDDDE